MVREFSTRSININIGTDSLTLLAGAQRGVVHEQRAGAEDGRALQLRLAEVAQRPLQVPNALQLQVCRDENNIRERRKGKTTLKENQSAFGNTLGNT